MFMCCKSEVDNACSINFTFTLFWNVFLQLSVSETITTKKEKECKFQGGKKTARKRRKTKEEEKNNRKLKKKKDEERNDVKLNQIIKIPKTKSESIAV